MSALERQSQVNPWAFLTSQPSLVGNYQTSERPVSKKQMVDNAWGMTFELCLCPTHTYTHTQTHIHTNTHTYKYTYPQTHTHNYIDTHRHICTHTYIHTNMYIHVHTCTHTHTCTQVHICTHTQTHTSTHKHTYAHTYTHKHTHVCTNTYMHIHKYTQTHTCTHKHTLKRINEQIEVRGRRERWTGVSVHEQDPKGRSPRAETEQKEGSREQGLHGGLTLHSLTPDGGNHCANDGVGCRGALSPCSTTS
jgi:hypothetical protein